ncbi:hypothetical protein PFISCL1PPCAC_29195, partial [Pristionchus fissidentatus]
RTQNLSVIHRIYSSNYLHEHLILLIISDNRKYGTVFPALSDSFLHDFWDRTIFIPIQCANASKSISDIAPPF